MTKPDDIPDDIWIVAEGLETEIDAPDFVPRNTELIARAILAEREACAKLGDRFDSETAAAIRNRSVA